MVTTLDFFPRFAGLLVFRGICVCLSCALEAIFGIVFSLVFLKRQRGKLGNSPGAKTKITLRSFLLSYKSRLHEEKYSLSASLERRRFYRCVATTMISRSMQPPDTQEQCANTKETYWQNHQTLTGRESAASFISKSEGLTVQSDGTSSTERGHLPTTPAAIKRTIDTMKSTTTTTKDIGQINKNMQLDTNVAKKTLRMHGETKPETTPKSDNSSTGPAMVDHGRRTITDADHGYITQWFASTFGMEKKEALWYTNQATENFKLHRRD